MNYFIGNQKIREEKIDGENTIVKLKDNSEFTINSQLLEKVKKEEKGNGNVTDSISDYFSRKFLAELAYYDLDYTFAMSIGSGIATLAHNLRENSIGKAFDCSCSETIKIKKITDEKIDEK